MPMSFESAKKHYNPDPDFEPDKEDLKEIMRIMEVSGWRDPYKIEPRKYTVNDIFVKGGIQMPMNVIRQPVVVKKVSKREFLTIEANRKYIEEHIKNNKK